MRREVPGRGCCRTGRGRKWTEPLQNGISTGGEIRPFPLLRIFLVHNRELAWQL